MVVEIIVTGMVQGVGFRPFVLREASRLKINGTVRNNSGIVTIVADAGKEALDMFIRCLTSRCPEGAVITDIQVREKTDREFPGLAGQPLREKRGFFIAESESDKKSVSMIPPDFATCRRCEAERKDKKNRRYRHPFISCVDCGPRYSIIHSLPYDRESTAMDSFPMCPVCGKEYRTQSDIRCHAQTIACRECGPRLSFVTEEERIFGDENALLAAVTALKEGKIIAVKDIGGYHLACLPTKEETVERLRLLKGREQKPFAVMFPDLETIQEYGQVSDAERDILVGAERPIVLLKKKKDFPSCVCGESRDIGAFLPCNPVQSMLLEETGPLIMTSANRSGEPIITEEKKMLVWLSEESYRSGGPKRGKHPFLQESFLYGVLTHDREILTPLDDSVMRVVAGRKQMIRRARGFVPRPVVLAKPLPEPVFAAGSDLKAVFALAKERYAYLSQYFGDLEEASVFETWKANITRMKELYGIEERVILCDRHPAYFSREYAASGTEGKKLAEVQHHRAHILSVMTEHGLDQKAAPVLGFAFDGTGYGDDGTIWGGEAFLFSHAFPAGKHVAGLEPVLLCGGDSSAKDGSMTAVSYLKAAGYSKEEILSLKPERQKDDAEIDIIVKAIEMKLSCVPSSSMGRLFDAAAALLGISEYNHYEGQSAVLLELAAEKAREKQKRKPDLIPSFVIPFEERDDGFLRWNSRKLIGFLVDEIKSGFEKEALALQFHYTIGDMVVRTAERIRNEYSEGFERTEQAQSDSMRIALSGGTFMNRILTEYCVEELEKRGFSVFINEQVPCNDGGIALGQTGGTL